MQQAPFAYEPQSRPSGSASPVSKAVPSGTADAGQGRPSAQPLPKPPSSRSSAERSAGCSASTSPAGRQAWGHKTGLQQPGAGSGPLNGGEVPGDAPLRKRHRAEASQPGSAIKAEATRGGSAPGAASAEPGSTSCAELQPAAHDAWECVPDSPLPEDSTPGLEAALPSGASTAPSDGPKQPPLEALPAGSMQHPASRDLPHQEIHQRFATRDLLAGGWGQGGLPDDDVLDSLDAVDLWPPHPPNPAHAAAALAIAPQVIPGSAAQHAQQGLMGLEEGVPAPGRGWVASAEQQRQQQQQPRDPRAGLTATSDASEQDHAGAVGFGQRADASPGYMAQIRQGSSAAGQVAEGVAEATSRPWAEGVAEGASGRGSTVVGNTGLGLPAVPNPKGSISEQRVIIHADVDCFYCQVGAPSSRMENFCTQNLCVCMYVEFGIFSMYVELGGAWMFPLWLCGV